VHGSNSIPNYPASHGCVRVSVPAMDFIWEQNLMPMRITVWVHGG
jgi:lipoprotein-anchoring transpeptidase ErfK/SrfK